MTRSPIALLLLAALAGAACSEPPTVEPRGDLSGTITVTDGDLDNVLVAIPGSVTVPDAEGRFVFKALVPGAYELSASKEGWVTATASATVAAGQIARVELTLTKEAPENRAPQLTSFSATPAVFARRETGRLLALGTDPDGDALTYTFSAGEGWTIADAGEPGSATITAPDASGAATTVKVTIADGKGGRVDGALLVSTSANRAPVVSAFVARASQLAPKGTTELLVSAADPDGDTLSYEWSAPEGWLVGGTGAKTTLAAPDRYDASALVEVTVTDADGAKAKSTVAVTTITNQAPIFASLVARPAVVRPGATSTITASAVDPNGDTLTFTWTAPEPWVVAGEGAQVTVTAPAEHDAEATLDVVADDGHGRSAKASVVLSTTPNATPSITSLTATPPQARPGAIVNLKASAQDPDGEPLTFSWAAPEGWTLAGAGPAVMLVAPARYGDVGEARVTATDAFGAQASASVVVSTVTNTGPLVTSTVALPSQASPKGKVRVVVAAADPDGDPLAYEWAAPQGWTIESGASAKEAVLVAPNEYGRSDTAVVTVSDGAQVATASVVVSTRTNRAPAVASISARPSPVAKGGTVTVDVSAADPDGDTLTYTWSATPGWAVQGSGASVTVKAPGTYAASGTVSVEVADGYGLSARAQVPVSTIENHAPVLLGLNASGSPADRNGSITLTASAGDLDGDTLTYRWIAPAGWTVVGTGAQVKVTAPDVLGQRVTVKVEVSDPAGAVVSGLVDVATKDNRAPTLASLSSTPVAPLPNASAALAVVASEPDGETLSYEWTTSNTAFSIAGTGATVALRVPATNGASTTITVKVRDPSGGEAVKTLTVTATSCATNTMNCDGETANGCEARLDGDPANCGQCGNQCVAPTPACGAGTCSDVITTSCRTIKQSVPASTDGLYTLDSDGAGPRQAFQAYCDMTTDGGGWTLAMVQPVGTNWSCLSPSATPPSAPGTASGGVMLPQVFTEIGAGEMYVFETGGGRILKFYYPRPGIPFVNNYRAFTERHCFDSNHYQGDAPHTGLTRSGWGHSQQACTTANCAGFKARNDCREDSTNSHPSWGNGPGYSQTYGAGSDCWFYGASTMSSLPSITTCPTSSRAPWGNYSTGNLSGTIALWVR